MTTKENVMQFLVVERKAKGLRQADLATLMGSCQQEVSRWESGRFLTFSALFRYADALGYDIELSLRQRPNEAYL